MTSKPSGHIYIYIYIYISHLLDLKTLETNVLELQFVYVGKS